TPGIRALQALCCDGEVDADPLASAAEREHLAAALLIRCLAAIERARPLPSASSQGHGAALADEVRAFVAARPDRTVPLDALADRFGVSRRHLTRLFREHVGLSVGAFQHASRLEAATELLIRTDLPVGEVAFRTGFESGSALARSLRRRDGRSPTEIRKASAAMARPVAR
ncbi:MAG: helix-turn-helix transcriptional regulator, partial [Actinomycetospora chiangmaiensis]|nr:helix-turn-helix transcriptional regulator [Actinomycetospora chiangmaiensis]